MCVCVCECVCVCTNTAGPLSGYLLHRAQSAALTPSLAGGAPSSARLLKAMAAGPLGPAQPDEEGTLGPLVVYTSPFNVFYFYLLGV